MRLTGLRGRVSKAFQPKVQPAPRCHSVKNTKARGNTEDLQDILDSKAKITRSIYGKRASAPTRDDDRRVGYTKSKFGRAEYSRQDSYELRRDIARHGGATHTLCFTDEVMNHEFTEGFKPVNIESYDGITDPAVWIEDFLLHIHMARGDDLHTIKYLPLKLKGPARHWLNSLPVDSVGGWEDLEDVFLDNFQGTYVRPTDADDLSHITQQLGESNCRLSGCRSPSGIQA